MDKECRKCGKRNHFIAKCKSKGVREAGLDHGESSEKYQTDVAAVNNWPPWFTTMNQGECSDLCAFVDGRGNYYPWPFRGLYASIASTWFGLHQARLKVVVLQPTVVSRFGCFVLESWVLRFRDLGASCFGLRFRVLRFRNYSLQPIMIQLQRIQLIPSCLTPKFPRKSMNV